MCYSRSVDTELTINAAAERLGISRRQVNTLVSSGVLTSRLTVENGRAKRYIPEVEVEALRRERQAQAGAEKKGKGRPPKVSE